MSMCHEVRPLNETTLLLHQQLKFPQLKLQKILKKCISVYIGNNSLSVDVVLP
jgi:hypothetical protein